MTEDLQYRLYNTSITPPGDAWPNIAEQLDREAQQKLSYKLQQAVLTPPANAWENILSALEAPAQAKVIPISRKWTRIAVAAITTGIIVLAGLTYFMSSENDPNKSASGQKKEQAVPPANSSNSNNQTNNASVIPLPKQTLTPDPVPVRIAKRAAKTRIRYARVDNSAFAFNKRSATNVVGAINEPLPVETDTYIRPQAYLTVAAPNGQPARISAKFTDAVGYLLTDEPAATMSAALKSISWKRRFQNWSNKLMASSAFIPAASNFLDIVELEELLKEQ
jgi:hypothetical protein